MTDAAINAAVNAIRHPSVIVPTSSPPLDSATRERYVNGSVSTRIARHLRASRVYVRTYQETDHEGMIIPRGLEDGTVIDHHVEWVAAWDELDGPWWAGTPEEQATITQDERARDLPWPATGWVKPTGQNPAASTANLADPSDPFACREATVV